VNVNRSGRQHIARYQARKRIPGRYYSGWRPAFRAIPNRAHFVGITIARPDFGAVGTDIDAIACEFMEVRDARVGGLVMPAVDRSVDPTRQRGVGGGVGVGVGAARSGKTQTGDARETFHVDPSSR